MILISARENFWSDTELAVKDSIKEVDLVDKLPSINMHEYTFWERVEGQRILLLVHGYNNEPEDVHNAYAVIEKHVTQFKPNNAAYDHVIGYIWPGGDDRFDYYSAKTRANALARRFGIWLQEMQVHNVTVDIMGHSMGARVILKGLKTLEEHIVRNVFTMAAAVDNESIQSGEDFFSSTEQCENIFVFHSKNDSTLKFAYSFAEWDFALGLVGPEDPQDIIANSSPADPNSPSVYVINCKNVIHRHGAYKSTTQIYQYISAILKNKMGEQYVTI